MEFPQRQRQIIPSQPGPSGYQYQQVHGQYGQLINLRLRRINLNGFSFNVPEILLENETIFRGIFSRRVFDALPPLTKQYLYQFLPHVDDIPVDSFVDAAFTSDPGFNFVNPLTKLRKKLQHNWFSTEKSSEILQLRDSRKVIYDHFIRQYYIDLMGKLLRSRHEILEKAYQSTSQDDFESRMKHQSYKKSVKVNQKRNNDIVARASRRTKALLSNVKHQAKDPNPLSSDDEIIDSKDIIPVTKTTSAKSTLHNTQLSDYDMHQPAIPKTIKEMLKEHRRLRQRDPHAPALDTEGITLKDVYTRAGLGFQSERNFAQQNREKLAARIERKRQLAKEQKQILAKK
ncbi:Hypothetical protein SRAE_X000123700 [Strongyloides ratti]|uniref:Uncharacterized protein n=1 Tax=Strongyloides ratti TaxID=34506 RepID=A0A090KQ30_STRRB|nr:Hypothetical protein SRAE_X000123700 [Strongyloides ratti]CEF59489.1 Hypothetical protein SRAE_X000123700 [Strongyloides ratti]